MSLLEKPILGHVIDLEESEEDQYDLNEALLFEMDRIDLLDSISLRISESLLKFYIDKLDLNDIEYFNMILNRLAKVYKLNYLKLHKYNINQKSEYIQSILTTLIFIKIRLISLVENNQLDKSISMEDFEKLLIQQNAPQLLVDSIKFIDIYSYEKFINRIFNEVKFDFTE